MEKFRIEATRKDEYVIEIDETVWDKQALHDWSKIFSPVMNSRQVAEILSLELLRNGHAGFIGGFGYVYIQRPDGLHLPQFVLVDGKLQKVTQFAEGIKVTIIHEDENFDTEILDSKE